MMRSLLIVSLFLLTLSSVFAFDITNADGEAKTFFSVNDPKVEIISENNFQNFTVTYTLLSSPEQRIFNLSSCGSQFCGSFLLTNLIQSLNDTFVGSKTFTISVGPINRSIFFDLENPTFTLNSLLVNNSEKKVHLDFFASDNSGIVKSLLLFKKIGGVQTQIANLTGKTEHSLSLNNSQDFILLFKVTDVAGNVQEHEEEVNVSDIFDPIITKTLLIQNEDASFSLEFSGTDDNLSSYSITQDSLSLSESVSGTSLSKTVSLPFTKGSVVFKLTDQEGNTASKTITLSEGSIELSSVLQYTNEKVFNFKSSDASSCKLRGVNAEILDKSFSKDGTSFEVSLSLDEGQGEYLINFTCEDSSSRAFFSKELIYDTQAPTKVSLEARANDEGEIELNWTKSADELSGPVRYQIFRDNNREAEQLNDVDFTDDEVEYPEEYEYFIRALDKAGNSVDSNTLTITPLKIAVRLDSNFKFRETVNEAEQRLQIYSEEGAKVTLTHLFDDEEIAKITFENLEDDIQEFDLTLKEGENEIILEAEDTEGNTKERTFFLTLESSVANTISTSQEDENVLASQNKNNESEASTTQETEEGSWTFWLWILFFLILLGAFIWFFIVREPQRKKAMRDKERTGWAPREKKKKKSEFWGSFTSSKDHYFEKDLKRIKAKRVQKQQEEKERREREKAREKREQDAPKTELQKQKLKDLAGRREINIPFAKRQEARKRVEHIEKEMGEKNFEREEQRKSQRKEKRFDPFSEYLNSSRIKRRWDSTDSYRASKQISQEEVSKAQQEDRVDPKQVQESIQKSQKKEEVQEQEKPRKERVDLDDYLNKRSKRRRWYFTERDVNRDLKSRRE